MPKPPTTFPTTTLIAAAGLLGGYGTARWSGNRQLGGVVLVAAGAGAAYRWRREAGGGAAVALTGLYVAAFGGSHPLAKRIGAWPSVFAVTGAVTAASVLATRGRS
ncbi:hypothetical protein OG455_18445 [Kitasatospora sp. NBC_01287]|uniref:hypothetical protein n=1 Tax=Kitasatospora sp. NBC_01287 TaxID=2903573 RepID=UPI002258D2EB|nr:hypothetical protein [Kitasatospora sp. NBC_01287]MCX4747475.1 hypothetical protein [Kitasatospora sp. NBC_01287]